MKTYILYENSNATSDLKKNVNIIGIGNIT